MIGTDATTPIVRSLVRDLAVNAPEVNREALREISRNRASELLKKNQDQQDQTVNRSRRPPREYKVDNLAFVIKYSQSTGKLDPGMRGPYRVTKVLPNGRYELKLLGGSWGKTTQAASQHMVPWKGKWCPETCASFFENDETNDSDDNSGHPGSSNRAAGGLSMPELDEVAAVASPQVNSIEDGPRNEPSGVEGDSASGEAVLGMIKPPS